MKRHAVALLLPLLIGACSSTLPAAEATYESERLVSVQHNQVNDYTLLVYRDPLGQMRHVLRRGGVCEVLLTLTATGAIVLKERGREARMLSVREATRIAERMQALVHAPAQRQASVSTI